MRALIFIVPFFVFTICEGQDSLCFTTVDTVGCAPFTVNVDNCASDGVAVSYAFDALNSIKTTGSTTNTYTEPGLYRIAQIGDLGNNSLDTFWLDQTIRVLETNLPDIDIIACEGNTAKIEISNGSFDRYVLDYGDGSPLDTFANAISTEHTYADSLLKTVEVYASHIGYCSDTAEYSFQPFTTLIPSQISEINQISNQEFVVKISVNEHIESKLEYHIQGNSWQTRDLSFTASSIEELVEFDQNSNNYEFRTYSTDQCGNSTKSTSNTLTHLPIKTTSYSDSISISWMNHNSVSIYKNNDSIGTYSGFFKVDTFIKCSEQYCYFLQTEQFGAKIKSLTECEIAFSTKEATDIDSLMISTKNNIVELSFQPVIDYSEIRIQSNQIDSLITDSAATFYLPHDFSSEPCYTVSYIDKCDNASQSYSACGILLNKPSKETLFHTLYEGILINRYELLILPDSQRIELNNQEINITEIDLPQKGNFLVVGTDNNGNTYYSNSIPFEESNYVFIPNAIAPEDPTANLFYPEAEFIESFQIDILSSDGVLLNSLVENTPWTGKINQNNAPEGVYLYKITFSDQLGNEQTKFGTVTVIY